jgi:predicted trehalose synthase
MIDYTADNPLSDQATTAVNAGFVARVGVAMAHVALAVEAEDPATASHTKRANLAFSTLANPATYSAIFALACVADGSTNSSSTDAMLLGRVATVWNAVAGTGAA